MSQQNIKLDLKLLKNPDRIKDQLQVIQNMARGLKPNKRFHNLMTNWRFRNVLTWEQLRKIDKSKVPDKKYFNESFGTKEPAFLGAAEEIDMATRLGQLASAIFRGANTLDPMAKNNAKLEANSYCNDTNRDLDAIFHPQGEAKPAIISATMGTGCVFLPNEAESVQLSEDDNTTAFLSRVPSSSNSNFKFTSFGKDKITKCEGILKQLMDSKKSRVVLTAPLHNILLTTTRHSSLQDITRPTILEPCTDLDSFKQTYNFKVLLPPCCATEKQLEFLFLHFKV
jgi:hypothetical protein